MKRGITLDFDNGALRLTADLFQTRTAQELSALLPREMKLTTWGHEVYGPLGADLGTENPQPDIEAGGLAYTNRGNYFCVFFGQSPAWPVEFVGRIHGDDWRKLRETQVSRLRIAGLEGGA